MSMEMQQQCQMVEFNRALIHQYVGEGNLRYLTYQDGDVRVGGTSSSSARKGKAGEVWKGPSGSRIRVHL